MLTPQQIQNLTLQAKARGYDDVTTHQFLLYADQQFQTQTPEPTPILEPQKQSGINVGGFIKEVAKDPLKTLLVKPAVRATQAGIAAYGGITGNQKAIDYSTKDQNIKFPLLGNINVEGQKTGVAGIKQVAGDAAKTASYLYTPGAATATAKTATAGGRILQGAKAGAVIGGLGAGGEAAIENKSALDIAKDTAIGAAGGAVIGGAIPAAVEGVNTLGKVNLPDLPRIKKPSIFQNNLVEKRLKELDNLEKYSQIQKQVQGAKARGFDVKKMVAETDLLHGAIDETGTIKTLQEGGAVSQIDDFIKQQSPVVSDLLKKEGKKVPFGLIELQAKKAINESGLEGSARVNAIKRLADDIQGYSNAVDKDGYVSLSKVHDFKVSKTANLNYLDAEKNKADKAISRALKDIIEKNTKSADVKSLNNELSKYYTLKDYVAALNNKKVDGGKLGKYFAQTLGGIVGSHFGPIGTMAGAEIAGKIKGYQMAGKFGKKIGKDLLISPEVQKALKKAESSVIHL